MNGLALFAIVFGLLVILFIPLRPGADRAATRRRDPRRRGPINLTLHRTDRS